MPQLVRDLEMTGRCLSHLSMFGAESGQQETFREGCALSARRFALASRRSLRHRRPISDPRAECRGCMGTCGLARTSRSAIFDNYIQAFSLETGSPLRRSGSISSSNTFSKSAASSTSRVEDLSGRPSTCRRRLRQAGCRIQPRPSARGEGNFIPADRRDAGQYVDLLGRDRSLPDPQLELP